MLEEAISFPYNIRTKQIRFGKWIYIIQLSQETSRVSRKFPTQDAALKDARELLLYMR